MDTKAPNANGDPIQKIIHKSNIPAPRVEQTPPQENGGSVIIRDTDGNTLDMDNKTGWVYKPSNAYAPSAKHDDEPVTLEPAQDLTHATARVTLEPTRAQGHKHSRSNTTVFQHDDEPHDGDCYVQIEPISDTEMDKIEAQTALQLTWVHNINDGYFCTCMQNIKITDGTTYTV
jgi:hypothetical protein